jgi:hypothetical protein
MSRDYTKLKMAFKGDPETLRILEQQESNELLREIASRKIEMSGATMIKGDKGDSPIKGVDYYTPEELAQIKDELTPKKGDDYFTPEEIEEIKSGIKEEVTPIKGVDYVDGKDADETKIITKLSKKIPTAEEVASLVKVPKPQIIDRKKLIEDVIAEFPEMLEPEELVERVIKEIKKKQRLEPKDIKGMPINMNDQRWHGGGASDAGNLYYTPQGVTTATVGGITAGTDLGFVPILLQDLITRELYPAITPGITLSSNPPAGLYEVGNDISSVDLTAITVKRTDPITSVIFYRDASIIYTVPAPNPNGGTEIYTDSTGVSSNTTYTATVSDGITGVVTSNALMFTFAFAYYYGSSAPGLDISSDGGGLTKLLIGDTPTLTRAFTTSANVQYFAYPASYPSLTSIKDKNNFETINLWNLSVVTVTNSYGQSTSYKKYEYSILNSNINFNFTFFQ